MRVVVMGCGRVGSALARAMDERGHEVAVIDRDESAFTRLGAGFGGQMVVGVGFDRQILERADVGGADAFAAVSSGDNSNIIAARVARETFDVPKVVARIYDARRAEVYERLGIPTVATVPWTTERLLTVLGESQTGIEWSDPSASMVLTRLTLDESWVGTGVARFQETTGARIAFLTRVGHQILPEAKTVLQQDDVVYAVLPVDILDETRTLAAGPALSDD